ncbi:IS1595 family transposase [Flammeovirga aprica]|uniref:IS1595 family transposase n=1 Tax=Flammeovirga aprica JL-4 TaxID=694437 RepID=A0A7X9RV32_9BACT|nr:IS1595 family transposase [Flammeovirga aprica]NME69255.1 IS1595 family transposase [Flammeovirga aprica JL-4]
MKIIEFTEKFPDEQSCINHFRLTREKEGITCKKCGCKKHYWLKAIKQWQCSSCNFRTTLRSGTIMHGSKLSIRKWYLANAYMTMTKKGISANEVKRQLNHSRYESIWRMMHKIREAMGKRDGLYVLEDMVEFDEGYFTTGAPESTDLKRGKGSQKQQNVAVMAESVPIEDIDTDTTSHQCRYFKMKVLESHLKDAVNECVKENIQDTSVVFSDKSTSYVDIEDLVEYHFAEKSTKEYSKNKLGWVHIAISNAKRTFLGLYHHMKAKYLQNYLDEFCYKLNRRYFGDKLFDRAIIAIGHQYC